MVAGGSLRLQDIAHSNQSTPPKSITAMAARNDDNPHFDRDTLADGTSDSPTGATDVPSSRRRTVREKVPSPSLPADEIGSDGARSALFACEREDDERKGGCGARRHPWRDDDVVLKTSSDDRRGEGDVVVSFDEKKSCDDPSGVCEEGAEGDGDGLGNDDYPSCHRTPSELEGRLDEAWAAAEGGAEHRGSNHFRESHLPEMAWKDDGNHFAMTNGGDTGFSRSSPLGESDRAYAWTSHPSETALPTNNLTTPSKDNHPTDLTIIPSHATHPSSKVTTPQPENQHSNENDRRRQQTQPLQKPPQPKRPTPPSLLQKYRTFLQKHEPSLLLLEHVMERFVFYRYLFHHDHRGIRTEMYYATWNVLRWMNDVILVGWGEGMGLTVGKREEWLGKEWKFISKETNGPPGKHVREEAWGYIQDWILARLNRVVPLIRAALTASTCLYPAWEAWSRRERRSRPTRIGRALSSFEDDPHDWQWKEYQWRATTTDPSPHRRRKEWEATQRNRAEASRRLESGRFYGRLGLLAISWWARYRRNCAQKKWEEDEEMPGGCRLGQKRETSAAVPSVLRGGGELDPYERLVPLQEAEDEANIVQYVGRRTGRRSVSRSIGLPKSSCVRRTSSTPSSFGANVVKWLSGVASSGNNILYAYAVGELLHILRPYYWSNAECTEWRKRSSSSSSSRTTMPGKSQSPRRATSYSLTLWKAWWISLLMDLLSDKLLRISANGHGNPPPFRNHARRTSLLSRGNGLHSHSNSSSSSPSAEQAKLEELDWRKSRHVLHLLRSPMYDGVTRPLAMFVGRVLAMFPSFGLGRWAAGYALDMMNYWNEHRFMLES